MSGRAHLLGINDLSAHEAIEILDQAEAFLEVSRRPVRKVPTLRGKTIINLFYEASTRTRTSFELAGKRLSADVINMSVATSSVKKGETLLDTIRTLQAMHPDVVVMRHSAAGAPHLVAKEADFAVVNAGDGMHEHPTQALLDAFTIRRKKGRIEGLTVTICGDIVHSRVARSNALLLNKLGCRVRFVGPRTLLPEEMKVFGAEIFHEIGPALKDADVVMVLRIQKERMEGALLPTMREYSRTFGINPERLKGAATDAVVMHPGPMNRGIEIDPRVADGPQSLILEQVEAGLAVRMGLLYRLGGGRPGDKV